MDKNLNFDEIYNLKNELDEFLLNYDKGVPIILYGFGGGILGMPDMMKKHKINVLAICDRDVKKHGVSTEGIDIISFEEALKKYKNFNVYITVSNSFGEIRAYLEKYISSNRIFAFGRKKNMSSSEYKKFLFDNIDPINYIYQNLEDDFSKKTMKNVISGTLTNNLNFFQNVFVEEQYFPKDIVVLGENEVFVDAGAFDGDTIKAFLKNSNDKFKRIYAYEPDERYADKILNIGKILSRENDIIVYKKALYSEKTNLNFNTDLSRGAYASAALSNGNIVQTETIDNTIDEEVTFIKMDIEGSELAALKGAENTIRRYTPNLAICIYHKCEDILEIPKYIMSLGLNYRYYLRHHTMSVDETVFYAINIKGAINV